MTSYETLNDDIEAQITLNNVFNPLKSFDNLGGRMLFIRKTYSLVLLQLMYTFGLVLIVTYNYEFRHFAQTTVWLMWICIILTFGLLFSLFCFWEVQKIYPYNYMFLTAFTAPLGYITAVAASIYNPTLVLAAIGTTGIIFIGLTLFAFQTKVDFTEFYGILGIALFALVVASVVMAFVCGKNECSALTIITSIAGILIFCGYIVVDTQMMIGGGHKRQFEPDEYVIAAINLYLDIINLFLYLLQLFGKIAGKD